MIAHEVAIIGDCFDEGIDNRGGGFDHRERAGGVEPHEGRSIMEEDVDNVG